MKKILPILFGFSLILSACQLNPSKERSKETEYKKELNEDALIENHSDSRMTNPKLIEEDQLLKIGDKNVELTLPEKQVQNPPTVYDYEMAQKYNVPYNGKPIMIHHSWTNQALHAVFVNPRIKPIKGSYSENVISSAWKYFGTPYEFGSNRNTPTTFDCSDYTRWIYLTALGMDLPKTSSSQWAYVKAFSKYKYSSLSQAKRGDLLFFMGYKGWQASNYKGINVKVQPVQHVGIYLGNGQMLHTASAKTGGVRVDKVANNHLAYRFIGGGSVLN